MSCHVFTYLKKEVEDIIKFLKKYPDTLVIVAITRQGWLNKFGAYILNEPDAHTNANLKPKDEIKFTKTYETC